ncbi:MAG: squalene/phytoene synthase family protein [Caulobacterales bacterium]
MPGDRDGLDQLIAKVDPDRWLATRFIGEAAARADVIALYAYDHELGRARRAASNALMAEIRLTWWREVLDQIFAGEAVRLHPTAQALAAAVARHGLPRGPLEAMIDGRIEALEFSPLDADQAVGWADAVQGSATALAAMILDPAGPPEVTAAAGRAWGLALLARSGQAAAKVIAAPLQAALAEARVVSRQLSVRAFPAVLHVTLARHDLTGRTPSVWRKQLTLLTASLRGRL